MVKIQFCPKCGSSDLEEVTEGAMPGAIHHYAGKNIKKCKHCGFTSNTFPETDDLKQINDLREKLRK